MLGVRTHVDDELAALLRERRSNALSMLDALTRDHQAVVDAARDSNGDDEHDPDGSTIAFERSQLDTMVASTRRTLGELDAALARLAAGTYGRCEQCGQPIPVDRLRARPATTSCIACLTR